MMAAPVPSPSLPVRTTAPVLYRTTFGIELPLHLGNELIESRLSRYGIEPLLLIADQIKANLIAQGWFDPANATH